MGDRYLRRLLVVGATLVIRRGSANTSATGVWVRLLRAHKQAGHMTATQTQEGKGLEGWARCVV